MSKKRVTTTDLALSIENLARMTANGFQVMNEKFDKIDEKFNKVDEKFLEIDGRFVVIDSKLLVIDNRLSSLEILTKAISSEVILIKDDIYKINGKLGSFSLLIAGQDKQIDNHEVRIERLESGF